MKKRLPKAIIQRTYFRNKFFENPTDENRYIYKKQRDVYASLLRKEKKHTLENLRNRISSITKNFGKLLNHFSEKVKSRESIVLIEKGKTISKEDEVANTLNDVFSHIVKNPNIPEHHVNAIHYRHSNYPTLKDILKYKNHPSTDTIRCAIKRLSSFYSSQVNKKTVIKEIKNSEIDRWYKIHTFP